MGFDAWGARRNGESNNLSDWNALSDSARLSAITGSLMLAGFSQPVTTRGYTGHEMVDDMGIIHMNGRIYDARLARFLQADPIIQAATNTQSYNRYSYVWNNPLNATDPSGFVLKKYWDKIRPYVGAIVAIVAGYFLCQNTCTVEIYAAIGAVSGAAGAAANGGNIAMGFVLGAFTGIAGNYGVIAAGVAGGFASYATGGKFGHGFASAGLGSIYGGAGQKIGGWQALAASVVIGGSISEATGGKFKNGAASAAFSYTMTWAAVKVGAGGVSHDEAQVSAQAAEQSSGFEGKDAFDSAVKALGEVEGLSDVAGSSINHKYDDRHYVSKYIDGKYKIEVLGGSEIDLTLGQALSTFNEKNGGGWRHTGGSCAKGHVCTIYRGATSTSMFYGHIPRPGGSPNYTSNSIESVLAVMAHEYVHYKTGQPHPVVKTRISEWSFGSAEERAVELYRGRPK